MNRRKRKSPYKHPVKSHTRKNRPVTNYVRGKGDQVIKQRKSRVVGGNPLTMDEYNIRISYGMSGERFEVDAKNYQKALSVGLLRRKSIERPKSVRMRLI